MMSLRVSVRKIRKGRGERIVVRCGCCTKSFEIHKASDFSDDLVEIAGVIARKQEWRKLFRQILKEKP